VSGRVWGGWFVTKQLEVFVGEADEILDGDLLLEET